MSPIYEPARSWDLGTQLWAINLLPRDIYLYNVPDHINHKTLAVAWAWIDNDHIKHLEEFHAPE